MDPALEQVFDPDWYCATYPDVAMSGMAPLEHFLWIGTRLGRKAFGASGERLTVHDGSRTPGPSAVAVQPVDQEDIALIRKSGLFDLAYYEEYRAQKFSAEVDGVLDYLQRYRVGDVSSDPGPLFSTEYYLQKNVDVVGIHPLIHYVRYGRQEGRASFCPLKINAYHARHKAHPTSSIAEILQGKDVEVYCWDQGNFFFNDIAAYIVEYLNRIGHKASLCSDRDSRPRANALPLIVAPHEFCVHGPGSEWPLADIERAAYFNTEQWQTSWFALALEHMRLSNAGILDINPASAAALASLGYKAGFLPMLPLPGTAFDIPTQPLSPHVCRTKFVKDLTYPSSIMARPYDLAFVAVRNARRGAALAKLAPTLSSFDCFVHCPMFERPVTADSPDMLSTADFAQIARNSKILLNIHRDESAYFEWHRLFLSGMMEGCVVVTEPCTPNDYVTAGVHYLECELDGMPALLEFLLSSKGAGTMARISRANATLRHDILANPQVAR